MADKIKEPIVHRYSLSSEEKSKVQNLQSVLGILALEREGISNTLMLELARARSRNNIKDSNAPEGYVRNVDFDGNKFEIIVTDTPIAAKPAEVKKEPETLKN